VKCLINDEMNISLKDKLLGCIVGGAIGDAVGNYYETMTNVASVNLDVLSGITDDTQLTLATCESILEVGAVLPENIARHFLRWYNSGRLVGLGSSTLKALRDLQVGAHWGLSGRSGEYAAGNGAAMRVAPLAFFLPIDEERTLIKDVCYITHKNDEAYVGCLSVLYALDQVIKGKWSPGEQLLTLVLPHLPDTGVKDNLIKLQENPDLSIAEAASRIGCSGHVVESVPFALFAAQQIGHKGFGDILSAIIQCGGDTDTNASIAGQIMGAFLGYSHLPNELFESFNALKESKYILQVVDKLSSRIGD
jgi:ADP-ribosyl-[dinitrogen reductase] hydrolase